MNSDVTSSVSLDKNDTGQAESAERDTECTQEATGQQPTESKQEQWKPCKQVALIFLVQCTIAFVIALDMTILTSTLPVRCSA